MAARRAPGDGKPAKIPTNLPKNSKIGGSTNKPPKNQEGVESVEKIQRSISYFYRLAGESDEDDPDFQGFTNEDVNGAREKYAGLKQESNSIRESIWELQGINKDIKDVGENEQTDVVGNNSSRNLKKKGLNVSVDKLPKKILEPVLPEDTKPKKGKKHSQIDLGEKEKSSKKSLLGFGKFIASKIGKNSPEIKSAAKKAKSPSTVIRSKSSKIKTASNDIVDSKQDISDLSDSSSHIDQKISKESKLKSPPPKKKRASLPGYEIIQEVVSDNKNIWQPEVRVITPADNLKPLLHRPLLVEGKRRWKPSYKLQQGFQGGSSTKTNSCDETSSVVSAVSEVSETSTNTTVINAVSEDSDASTKDIVKQFVSAMTADVKDDAALEINPKWKKIERTLATQWDSRLNRSDKTKDSNKAGSTGRLTPSTRPILRESVLDRKLKKKKSRGSGKSASVESTSASESSEFSSGDSSASSGLKDKKSSSEHMESESGETKPVTKEEPGLKDTKSKSFQAKSSLGKVKSVSGKNNVKTALGKGKSAPGDAGLDSKLSPEKAASKFDDKAVSDLKVQEDFGSRTQNCSQDDPAPRPQLQSPGKSTVHEELAGGWYKKAIKKVKRDLSEHWEVHLLSPDLKVIRSSKELKMYVSRTGSVIDENVVNFVLPKDSGEEKEDVLKIEVEENSHILKDKPRCSLTIEDEMPSSSDGNHSARVSRRNVKSVSVAQKHAQKVKKKALRQRIEAEKIKSMEEDSAEDSTVAVIKREPRTPKKADIIESCDVTKINAAASDKECKVLADVKINVKQIKSTSRQIAMAKADVIKLANSLSSPRKSANSENSSSPSRSAKSSPRKSANSEISSTPAAIGRSSPHKVAPTDSLSTQSPSKCEEPIPSPSKSSKSPAPLFQDRTRRGKRQSSLMVEKAVRALAARSKRGTLTAKPTSTRWKAGKFICTICGKDCGYKQNLFFHMKKHEKYGENVAVQNEKLVQRNAKEPKKLGRKKTKSASPRKIKIENEDVDIESVEETKTVAAVCSRVLGGGVVKTENNLFEEESKELENSAGGGKRKRRPWKKGIYLCSECNKDCGFPENLQIHERKHARQLAKLQAKIFSKHQNILKQEMKDSKKRLSIESSTSPPSSKNSRTTSPTRWANGVPPARWVWGRFVCDQCEKDCGYSQNLSLHRKRTHGLTVRQERLRGQPQTPVLKPKKVEKAPSYSDQGMLPVTPRIDRIVEGGLVKSMPCKDCPACLRPDCGDCNHCWDKKKFGGPAKLKRRCKKRTCLNPKPIGSPSSVSANYVRKLPHFVSSKAGLGTYSILTGTTSIPRKKEVGSEDMESCSESRPGSPVLETKESLKEIRASLEDFIEMGLGKEAPDESGQMEVDEFPHVKKYGAGKSNPEVKPEMRTVPVSVAHLSPSKCEVSVDYWEQYDPDTAALQGHAVMAESEVAIPELCFLCGSAGHGKMLYCRACCEPFHPFCLHTDDLPQSTKAESCWVCRRCTACKVCGGAENTASGSMGADRRTCVECRDMFHTGCLPAPLREVKHSRPWTCGNCLRCGSCGSASVQHYVEDEPLCSDCCQARSRGSYCSVCRGCYEDDDFDLAMMECGKCGGWIHARCEGIDGEEYQVLSYLPDSVEYICKCNDPVRRSKPLKTLPLVNSYQPLGLVGTHLTPVPDATPDSPAKSLSSLNSLNPMASSYVDLGDNSADAAIDSSFIELGDTSASVENSFIFSVQKDSPSPMDAIDDDHDAPLDAFHAIDDGLDDFVTLDSSVMALNFSLSSSPSHA